MRATDTPFPTATPAPTVVCNDYGSTVFCAGQGYFLVTPRQGSTPVAGGFIFPRDSIPLSTATPIPSATPVPGWLAASYRLEDTYPQIVTTLSTAAVVLALYLAVILVSTKLICRVLGAISGWWCRRGSEEE